jgi:NodT family efflux transporter outer membrane factor (OMF) lipoprotein
MDPSDDAAAAHTCAWPLPRALAGCILALGLAGCATPVPRAPGLVSPLSEQFAHRAGEATTARIDADWWRGFGDPTLAALVERGLEANPDVRSALARVRAARAGLDAQAARLLPTVNLQAGASRSTSGLPAAVKQDGQPDVRVAAGAVQASWEIDLAGGVRAARGAARADAAAAQADVAGTRLLVAGDIARLYFTLRGAQERLRILQALAQAQRDTERTVARRAAEGQASGFDVDRAQAEADSVDAQIPQLHTLLSVTRSRLAVLMGEDPSAAVDPAGPGYSWPAPRDIGSGQPSDLLRRRPDLIAAEMRLAAQSLRSAEARAQTWPRLFVGALVGREDLRIDALDLAPVRFASVAAAFAMPLFDAGRLRAGIQAQDARESEALLAWQKAALTAVEDVENSLTIRGDEVRRGVLLEAAAAARRQSLRRAQSLYREGQIDLLALLDVQRSLLASEMALAENAMQRALADVQLFKALGGGWQPPRALASVHGTPATQPSRTLP